MRNDVQKGYHAVRGSIPTFDHDKIVEEVVQALRRGKQGINFRNAGHYWVSSWRGKKIYYCEKGNGWGSNTESLASDIRCVLAPEGYINEGLAGHDQYYDLAATVAYRLSHEVR